MKMERVRTRKPSKKQTTTPTWKDIVEGVETKEVEQHHEAQLRKFQEGLQLRKIRAHLGLSQIDMSAALQVPWATYLTWERGFVCPSPKNRKKLKARLEALIEEKASPQ